MSHVFAVLLCASLFPPPILKSLILRLPIMIFFNFSRVRTREASAVPERLKAGLCRVMVALFIFLIMAVARPYWLWNLRNYL